MRLDDQPAVRRAVDRFVTAVHERFRAEVAEVRLFGSSARDDWRPGSDVDLLVLVERKTWDLAVELQGPVVEAMREDHVDLSLRIVPVEAWRAMVSTGRRFARNVGEEGVILWTRASGPRSTVTSPRPATS